MTSEGRGSCFICDAGGHADEQAGEALRLRLPHGDAMSRREWYFVGFGQGVCLALAVVALIAGALL